MADLEEQLRRLFVENPEKFDQNAVFSFLAQETGADRRASDAPAQEVDNEDDPHQLRQEIASMSAHIRASQNVLKGIQLDLEQRISELRSESVNFQDQFQQELKEHRANLVTAKSQMESLEQELSTAGIMPKRVGHLLLHTETARLRLVQAGELLKLFQTFQRLDKIDAENTSELEKRVPALFTDDAQLLEATKLLPALKRVCHGLEGEAYATAIHNIQQTSNYVENRLLDRFESASTREDIATMRECAMPLCRFFNGGGSLHNRYFNSIVMPNLLDLGSGDLDDEEEASAQDMLSRMFGAIHRVCAKEFNVIRNVFPRDSVMRVTRMLVQRIFMDPAFGIQNRVDEVLSPPPPAEPLPLADFLDVLCMVHEKTTALVEMLMEHCTPNATAAAERKDFDLVDSIFHGAESDSDDEAVVVSKDKADIEIRERRDAEVLEGMRSYLEEQVLILFREHKRDFLRKESFLMTHRLTALMRDQCDASYLGAVAAGRGVSHTELPAIVAMKIARLDQLFQGPLHHRFLQQVCDYHGDVVYRCSVILKIGEERAGAIARTFSSLLKFLSQNVYCPCLDAACLRAELTQEHLTSNIASAPHRGALTEVAAVLKCVQDRMAMVEGYYKRMVLKEVAKLQTPIARTICGEARVRLIREVETKASDALTLMLNSFLLGEEVALRENHDKLEYCSKEGGGELHPTPAARELCESVVALRNEISNALPKLDLSSMWVRLTSLLKDIILEQILRMKVSIAGSFQLKADLDLYCATVRKLFHSEAISKIFSDLTEIVTLFMVPGPNIADLLHDGAVSELPQEVLVDLIKRRADFKTSQFTIAEWAQKLFSDLGVETTMGVAPKDTSAPAGEVDSPPRSVSQRMHSVTDRMRGFGLGQPPIRVSLAGLGGGSSELSPQPSAPSSVKTFFRKLFKDREEESG